MASSSSSSSNSAWTYDVFLSFSGVDTRSGFTSNLYNALTQAGIHVFMDDRVIEKGEEISISLMQAIERSRIAIVVFSIDYASSRWCLDELVKIMECRRTQAQVVIPIFYDVSPSDVRHQRNSYGTAMKQHEQILGRGSDWVLQWREALTAAANISGRVNAKILNPKSKLVKLIVEDVLDKLDVGQLFVASHLVGIESRFHEMTIEWSQKRSQKARIIGLWGMGGTGKTTVAKTIYNKIGRQFEARSFLANIRENSKHAKDQVNLQKQLIYDVTKTQVFKIPNVDRGKKIIQERFPHIKAFVVLDDVDSVNQLNALCGSHEWFCPGSVIIITTRDLRMLNILRADHKYKMREMNKVESLRLFSWHAFKQADPFENFKEISKSVVAYCGGLPLALEVLGSYLFDREIEEWEDVLSKLERIPNDEIQAKLKISYDGLKDDMEKNIFLDICCFFINKDINFVTQILNGCGFNAKIGITTLIERSLINVNRHNKVEMHDLLCYMGREIICGSPRKDPEDRSRLWFYEDVIEVLTNYTGTNVIEGISLKLPHRECVIDSEAFKAMKKLRLLQLDYVNLKGDYRHLSQKLRWLCWHGFPLKSTPDSLYQENLVVLDFKYSNLELLWKKPQLLGCLTILILSHSPDLEQTPDFTYLPSLERLVMKDCSSLMLVHESIGDLKKLLHVNLKECKNLRDLPRSIYKLKSLKTLILSGCLLIDHLQEDIEQMESLTTFMADNTAITQVPFSLARLGGLVHGYVSLCGYEGRAQDIFPSLVWSWMSSNNIPQSHIEEFAQSVSSIVFSVGRNNGFRGISPFLGDLVKLRGMWEEYQSRFQFNGRMARLLHALYETDFMGLESTRNTLQISCTEASEPCEGHVQVHIARPSVDSFNSLLLQMGVCNKADLLKEKISQGWHNSGWDDSYLPGDQCPDWFMYKGEGHSVIFKVPQVKGCHLKAMLLNVVYSCCMDNTTPQFFINVLIINYTKATVIHHKGDWQTFHENAEWQSIISSVQPGDLVELVLSVGPQFPVEKIAAYLIYDHPMDLR